MSCSSWWERALLNWLRSALCFCLCPRAGLQHSLGRLWSPFGNSSWPVLLDVFVNLCSSKGRQVVLYSICIVFAGHFALFVCTFCGTAIFQLTFCLIMLRFPVCSLLHPEMKRVQMLGSWMQKFMWGALGLKESQIRSELVPSDLSFLWLITAEHMLQTHL